MNESKQKTKLARDIVPGDKVIVAETDDTVTIARIGKGFLKGSLMLEWHDAWVCVDPDDELILAE